MSEKISRHGYASPPALQSLRRIVVQQLVVGPNHIALLLEVPCRSFFKDFDLLLLNFLHLV